MTTATTSSFCACDCDLVVVVVPVLGPPTDTMISGSDGEGNISGERGRVLVVLVMAVVTVIALVVARCIGGVCSWRSN